MFPQTLPGWTNLPNINQTTGTHTRDNTCTGCLQPISSQCPQYKCHFYHNGFTSDGISFRPCRVTYHKNCIRAGPPFRSRHPGDKGLCFPHLERIPVFICEACSVRNVLRRELRPTRRDLSLLGLERMRMIDTVNSLAQRTLTQYQSYLRKITQFETLFGCKVVSCPKLPEPPGRDILPTLWCQEWYAVRKPTRGRYARSADRQVTFGSARGIRSAVGFHELWCLALTHPGRVTRTSDVTGLLLESLPSNDAVEYRQMMEGMARRMGDEPVPPTPLRRTHIRWIVELLDQMFLSCNDLDRDATLQVTRGALVVLMAWLGWLRSTELFSLRACDVTMVPPSDGPRLGLPRGVGAVGLTLLPSTKGSQTAQADVWVAFTTASGLSLGTWWGRYLALTDGSAPGLLIFRHADDSPWNSAFFRHKFLYPWLHTLRMDGDPYLSHFDGTPGRSIPENFYSMGSFRRGARLDVSERQQGSVRKATKEERFEHERWLQKKAPDIDVHYLEWGMTEKIRLTLLSM